VWTIVFRRSYAAVSTVRTVNRRKVGPDPTYPPNPAAIIDTSVTTILTAAVLYQYGTGPVQGFAVTLIAGITASLFTAIFVVRTFYLLWLSRSRGAQTLSI